MTNKTTFQELSIDSVKPDISQPRKRFDQTKLEELAESIKRHGLLQPILVCPIGNGKHKIVHGERRWRACKLAGKPTIRVNIRNLDEKEKVEIQLVENLQRENLNPVEEAETFKKLVDEFGYTHEELGKRIGKSREYVSNKLRLLDLHENVKQKLSEGSISEGHAKAILSLEPDKQDQLLKKVVKQGLKVRETESLVRQFKQGENVPRGTSTTPLGRLVDVRDLEVRRIICQPPLIKSKVPVKQLLDAYIKDLKMLRGG